MVTAFAATVPSMNVLKKDDSLLPVNGFKPELSGAFGRSRSESESISGVNSGGDGEGPAAEKATDIGTGNWDGAGGTADSFGGK